MASLAHLCVCVCVLGHASDASADQRCCLLSFLYRNRLIFYLPLSLFLCLCVHVPA